MSQTSLYPECRHIMPSGKRCHAPAMRGQPTCYYHGRNKNLVRHNREREYSVALPPLEDRAAIQMALDAVIAAHAAGKLDRKAVWPYLITIQMASQNLARANEELATAEQVDEVQEVDGQNYSVPAPQDAPVVPEDPIAAHSRGFQIPKLEASSHECDREKPLPYFESPKVPARAYGGGFSRTEAKLIWKKSDDWVKQFNSNLPGAIQRPDG